MAEDGVTRDIEAALNNIVNTTEQSGNMRKELKKTIYETVRTLRNLFVTLNVQLEERKSEKGSLERKLKDTKIILNERMKFSNKADTERRPETSSDRGVGECPTSAGGQVLPPHKHSPKLNHKLYSDSRRERRKEIHVNTPDKRQSQPEIDNKSTERKSESIRD
jgi:hypothetical protein